MTAAQECYIVAIGRPMFFVNFSLASKRETEVVAENARKVRAPSNAHRFTSRAEAEGVARAIFALVDSSVFVLSYLPDADQLGQPERILALEPYTPNEGVVLDAKRCKIEGVKIKEVDAEALVGVLFVDCDFTGVFDCLPASFIGCVFRNCNFEKTRITHLSFVGCDFDSVNAKGCEWRGSARSCEFADTDFSSANLSDFDFIDCNLGGVEWESGLVVLSRHLIDCLGL